MREEAGRDKVYRFAGERIAAGERVYVVVPAIEEGEREIAATQATAGRVRAALPGVDVGVLHGRMPAAERTALLRDFALGRVPVLVSTTVIEVGVDVPEATLMVVENAEVFGLAQLHQLRGRVGRSGRKSWCALIAGKGATEEARARLAVLESTSDGFLIAEKDLEARGPGRPARQPAVGDPGHAGRGPGARSLGARRGATARRGAAAGRDADRERPVRISGVIEASRQAHRHKHKR